MKILLTILGFLFTSISFAQPFKNISQFEYVQSFNTVLYGTTALQNSYVGYFIKDSLSSVNFNTGKTLQIGFPTNPPLSITPFSSNMLIAANPYVIAAYTVDSLELLWSYRPVDSLEINPHYIYEFDNILLVLEDREDTLFSNNLHEYFLEKEEWIKNGRNSDETPVPMAEAFPPVERPYSASISAFDSVGTKLYQFFTKSPYILNFDLYDNQLVISTRRGNLYSLNATTGELQWELWLEDPVMNMEITNESIFIHNQEGLYKTISRENAEELQTFGYGDVTRKPYYEYPLSVLKYMPEHNSVNAVSDETISNYDLSKGGDSGRITQINAAPELLVDYQSLAMTVHMSAPESNVSTASLRIFDESGTSKLAEEIIDTSIFSNLNFTYLGNLLIFTTDDRTYFYRLGSQ